MRLMGIGKLYALATSSKRAVAGAAAALRAELAAARWGDAADAADTYPNAKFTGHRIEIWLPDNHAAIIAVNYGAGVVLVEFAGQRGADACALPNKKRKRA